MFIRSAKREVHCVFFFNLVYFMQRAQWFELISFGL